MSMLRVVACAVFYWAAPSAAEPAYAVDTARLPNVFFGAVIGASSSAGEVYRPERAVDEDLNTRFATAGFRPFPHWLEVKVPKGTRINTLIVFGVPMERLYASPEKVRLEFSRGEPIDFVLKDTPGPQILRFERRQTDRVRLVVRSAYKEKHYIGFREIYGFYDPGRKIRQRKGGAKVWKEIKLTREEVPRHPTVYLAPEDIKRARSNLQRHEWAKKTAAAIKAEANGWLDWSDEKLLSVLPKEGACFAYGITGCPICSASWGTWGGARASFDDPGHVTCANGHRLPDKDHPDSGTGYVGRDGRIHYFVGSYNAWVVERLWYHGAQFLAYSYSLYGDEAYADRASAILDGLAKIYPSCDKGSWDYPSNPPSGRFNRPWYQVARVLVHYVNIYDQIYNSPVNDKPSVVKGLTRRQNIERNLLRNGARYCYEQSTKGGLHNGEADYNRGVLAVGVCLGIPEYIRWVIQGPYSIFAMLNNNVDRDGRYYETSLSYANHTRELYLTFSEPLFNYRGSLHPKGLNLFRFPRFRKFYELPDRKLDCAGHAPRYGDASPDVAAIQSQDRAVSRRDIVFLEKHLARAENPAVKKQLFEQLYRLAGGEIEKSRSSSQDRRWLLFHAEDIPEDLKRQAPRPENASPAPTLLPQKGIAILRSGAGKDRQALLLRYGPSLNHGHLDDLNINYFALGYELTYDLGYGLGSTHTQVGWSKQTISHNLVTINEKSQGGASGGSLHLFSEGGDARVIEASSENSYRALGVRLYRRTLALIGQSARAYLVDIFRVAGGRSHDYGFHALGTDVEFLGIDPGPSSSGSMAGPEFHWGDLQLSDGDMKGIPNKPYWNPPPGNGYGFLMEPQKATPSGIYTAEWKIKDNAKARVRLHVASEPDTLAVTAWAPGIYPRLPKSRYLINRRRGENLVSAFAAVVEPYGPAPAEINLSAGELLNGATDIQGELKFIPSIHVLLFKASERGKSVTFDFQTAREGEFILGVTHYLSTAYGAARLLFDGQPVGQAFKGTSPSVKPGPSIRLGRVRIHPGRHSITLEVTEPDGPANRCWMGLQRIFFEKSGAEAGPQPFIESIERARCDTNGDFRPVGLRIRLNDGTEDWVLSSAPSRESVFRFRGHEISMRGALAHIRKVRGSIQSVHLEAVRQLRAPGLSLQLAAEAFTARVTDVNPREGWVHVAPGAEGFPARPNDLVTFNNQDYSRNTVYRIERAERRAEGIRLQFGKGALVLGQGELDSTPRDSSHLTTFIPHDYIRSVHDRSDSGFFQGKEIRNLNGDGRTLIRRAAYGQPVTLEVDDSSQFNKGDRFIYVDVRSGDTARVRTVLEGRRTETGQWSIQSNAAGTLDINGVKQTVEAAAGEGDR